MRKKKIDYETILACKAGDGEAFKRVLAHYDALINSAASKIVTDEYGMKKWWWISRQKKISSRI